MLPNRLEPAPGRGADSEEVGGGPPWSASGAYSSASVSKCNLPRLGSGIGPCELHPRLKHRRPLLAMSRCLPRCGPSCIQRGRPLFRAGTTQATAGARRVVSLALGSRVLACRLGLKAKAEVADGIEDGLEARDMKHNRPSQRGFRRQTRVSQARVRFTEVLRRQVGSLLMRCGQGCQPLMN